MTTPVRIVRHPALVTALAASLLGCAADRIGSTAGDAATYVTAFQSDLVNLQTDLTDYQKQQTTINAERGVDTTESLATTARAQSVMTLLACNSPSAVFAALQSEGNMATSTELATAPVPASPPTLPTGKLAAIAASLTKLSSKPGASDDIDTVLEYGAGVGNSLKAPAPSGTASAPKN